MFEVGKHLWRSSNSTSLLNRVTYSILPRIVSRWLFNISREADSATSIGNLCQFSVSIRVKKFFLMFRWNFLCCSLYLLPYHWTPLRTVCHCPLDPPFPVYDQSYTLFIYPLRLLFFRPTSLSLSSYERFSSPLIILVTLHWTTCRSSKSLFYWESPNWTQ